MYLQKLERYIYRSQKDIFIENRKIYISIEIRKIYLQKLDRYIDRQKIDTYMIDGKYIFYRYQKDVNLDIRQIY